MTIDTPAIATLKFSTAEGETAFVLRDADTLSVGRDDGNDVCLLDTMVSRWHLTLSASGQGLSVNDLQSTNGTFVNGRRISGSAILQDGDLVDVGSAKIVVMLHARAHSKSPPVAPEIKRSATAQFKPVQVAVLVASIADFERLAARFPVESTTKLHLEWNDRASAIVESSGGKVDKMSGSDLVCYWFDDEETLAAKKACSAVIELRSLVEELPRRHGLMEEGGSPFRVTMVVASGMGLKASGAAENGGVKILGNPSDVAFQLAELVGKLGVDVVLCENTARIIEQTISVKQVIRIRLGKREQAVPVFTLKN